MQTLYDLFLTVIEKFSYSSLSERPLCTVDSSYYSDNWSKYEEYMVIESLAPNDSSM